jgi:hypothetical protein
MANASQCTTTKYARNQASQWSGRTAEDPIIHSSELSEAMEEMKLGVLSG